MNVIQRQCFTCVDDASFRYHGQSGYDAHKAAIEYVEAYEELGRPIIECVSCGRRIQYDKGTDGIYREVKVPKINREGVIE